MPDQKTDDDNTGSFNWKAQPVQNRTSPAFRPESDRSVDNNAYRIPGVRTYDEEAADL